MLDHSALGRAIREGALARLWRTGPKRAADWCGRRSAVRPGSLRRFTMLGLLMALGWGCSRGTESVATPTGPTTVKAADAGKQVTAHLSDAFLSQHNAAFFGGRTFRWVPPIPIFIDTDDAALDQFVLNQFLAWETALAGAGGKPFYAPQPATRREPFRGIFFVIDDFLFDDTGVTHTFDLEEALRHRSASLGRRLGRVAVPLRRHRQEVPAIRSNGEIRQCAIELDTALLDATDAELAYAIRHEVGHCLGFIGHVPSGVMAPLCCSLDITPDVSGMMRKLYTLPPGTEVTR